jgi:hypothetical protein
MTTTTENKKHINALGQSGKCVSQFLTTDVCNNLSGDWSEILVIDHQHVQVISKRKKFDDTAWEVWECCARLLAVSFWMIVIFRIVLQ